MITEFDALWRGGSIPRTNGENAEVEIRTFPRPVQRELSYWLTCTASPERFVEAGTAGFNVLTALLFQTPAELEQKVSAYRAARASRHDGYGHVTLMLHTYLSESADQVRETVRAPFTKYLESSMSLWKDRATDLDIREPQSKELLLGFAFQRYFKSAALFGTVESCRPFVAELAQAGIDEIACLIDFGLDGDIVLAGLEQIAGLAKIC